MIQQQFFDNKVVVWAEENLTAEIDVFVNLCGPNILTGLFFY